MQLLATPGAEIFKYVLCFRDLHINIVNVLKLIEFSALIFTVGMFANSFVKLQKNNYKYESNV